MKRFLSTCFGLTVIAAAASYSSAALIDVDFGIGGGSPSPVESGFTSVAPVYHATATSTYAANTATFTIGTYHVTFADFLSAPGFRDRGTTTGSMPDLYRDFYYENDNDASTVDAFSIQVADLTPSTAYDVTFYAYDGNPGGNTRTQTYSVLTGTGSSGTSSYVLGSPPATPLQDAVILRVTTDSSGAFKYKIQGDTTASKSAFVLLNGFSVAAVPEPGSVAAFLGLAGIMLRRAGRRRSSAC